MKTQPQKTKQKPKLKDQQLNILLLLYKFRYLNRNQIQKLLNHKQFNRIIVWLNELTNKKYLNRDFNRKFAGVPSVYYHGAKAKWELMGRKDIKEKLLGRVYQEKRNSQVFKNHCMFIADIYLALLELVKKHKAKLKFYTKTDLEGLRYLVLPHPDAFFSIEEQDRKTKRYFLDVFDDIASEKWLYKRVKQYFYYYSKNYWQDHNSNPFPEIIFVYSDSRSKNVLERTIKKGLEDEGSLIFSLTTWDEIKHQGISRQTLHKVSL